MTFLDPENHELKNSVYDHGQQTGMWFQLKKKKKAAHLRARLVDGKMTRCPPTQGNFLKGIDNKTVRRKQNGSNCRVFLNIIFVLFF